MSSKIKRLLIVLLLAAVMTSAFCITAYAEETESAVCYTPGDVNQDGSITSRDAIYVLYSIALDNGSNYPVSQNIDFNGDGENNIDDAIWLLYASLGMGSHQLEEIHHIYLDPIWTWTQNEETEVWEATVSFPCACGNSDSSVVTAEVTESTTSATCTAAGKITYTASVEFGGSTFSDTCIVDIPAAGHSLVTAGENACTQVTRCENCDYSTTPAGHSYTVTVTEATCQNPYTQETWTCNVCSDTITKNSVKVDVPCSYVLKSSEDMEIDAAQCLWAKKNVYKCSVCDDTEEEQKDEFHKHIYTASLTQEPTCSATGIKTYTCSVCSDTYTETVSKNPDAHSWDNGTPGEDGSTTHTCTLCYQTKTTVAMTDVGLTAEALSQAEVSLDNGVAISLDNTAASGLDAEQSVVISVTEADKSTLNLIDEQKDQIGGSTVYDFNMSYADSGEAISEFDGYVTISLPYTLQEGDDIDAIDVWFIDGGLEPMNGTYANGFVTFTTNHFSYYTVTRLTPAERCARYGHMNVEVKKTPTCTSDGYTATVCQRCGHPTDKTTLPATGHSYNEVRTEPTCTQSGSVIKTCSVCSHSVTTSLPALGHSMQHRDDLSEEPGCGKPGKDVYICEHGCGHQQEITLPEKTHEFDESYDIEPDDCSGRRHKRRHCKHCNHYEDFDFELPAGHDFPDDGKHIRWEWHEDKCLWTLHLTCKGCSFTHSQQGVVTKKYDGASCLDGRTPTYTAKVSYNNHTYHSPDHKNAPEVGQHVPGDIWYNNAQQHYYKCTLCKTPLSSADHTWNEGTITPATCSKDGTAVYSCLICGYKRTETLPATGSHTYEDGKCTVCGTSEIVCNHIRTYKKTIDLSSYNICGTPSLVVKACECGKQSMPVWQFDCSFVSTDKTVIDENGFMMWVYTRTCKECGLVVETYDGDDYDAKTCTATYYQASKVSFNGTTIMEAKWLATEEMMIHQHPAMLTGKVVDLRENGFCSEVLNEYACPCGEEIRYEVDYSIGGCSWNHISTENITTESDIVTEVYVTYKCSECGAEKHMTDRYQNIDCYDTDFMTYTYYDPEGEQVFEYDTISRWPVHDYEIVKYEAYGDSCEDGLYLWYECKNCDKAHEVYSEGHSAVKITEIDLTEEEICINKMRQTECACGLSKQSYSYGEGWCSFNYQSSDAATGAQTFVCSQCSAVRILTASKSEKDENCKYIYSEKYEYYDKNGKHLATTYNAWESESHDYSKVTYELLPGATSCEDGVKVINTCENCGASQSYTTAGHTVIFTDAIDLSNYNAICGSYLGHYSCPCGAKQRYDFTNDSKCDIEQVSTSVWIEGALSGSQWTTDGSHDSFGGNAYIFTCAVTDPQQCDLKIRMAEYWLQEDNCTAKEYQTWQLGYDELTNTCDKEITVATGESLTRHPYKETVFKGTTDDGTYLHCTTEVCPDCSSSCEVKFWYPDSTKQAVLKYQRNVVNTLNNGMNKQFTYTYCSDLVYAGYRYWTMELTEYIYSDSSTYWKRNDYAYDFPAGCVRTRTYTDSNGGYSVSSGTDHRKSYVNDYDPSTCTQYGTQYQGNKCNVCGHTDSNVISLEPKAHKWVWSEDQQLYICSYCNLENTNGASGKIVLEDMTDDYGGGTDYVIGYWNRGGIDFTPVVQIVLDDVPEDQDNLLSLSTPVNFTYREDIVAVSCSKDEAQAAVDAALAAAGYSGSYAIRITFLPASPTGELDYAITFDS